MSPEQDEGAATAGPASDVYSPGVILFELLTGQLPFQGSLEPKLRAEEQAAIGALVAAEMEVRGSKLRVEINGDTTLETDLKKFADQAEKIPGLKRSTGRIGLQSHTASARFRKIEVKELKKE